MRSALSFLKRVSISLTSDIEAQVGTAEARGRHKCIEEIPGDSTRTSNLPSQLLVNRDDTFTGKDFFLRLPPHHISFRKTRNQETQDIYHPRMSQLIMEGWAIRKWDL